ncbi:DUF4232 domain-containing protein [Actinoplanes xinjiangensis]|uniref:Uncharacterized protein DUF4232 n=1 Tax=Actinoplanes xinjiangensis TaxID=512350 RepID=A0A316FJF8_9ACTN|nr:DUF4232 domain-containing protein [Actinoplanes xinjiangensis]PWK49048.1 uncharacterized protein DUF4232 [Actinoplanes xinjiangensis]
MNISLPRVSCAVLLLAGGCAAPGTVPEPETGRSTPARPAPSVSVTRSPDPVPRCIDGLEISVGEGDAASGLRVVGLQLRNCGGKPYRIKGYPELSILDEDRKPLDVRVLRGIGEVTALPPWEVQPKQETLAPGESVRALLAWRNLTTDAETVAVGEFVSVAAGAGQSRHLLALHIDAGNTGKVAISPWISGT